MPFNESCRLHTFLLFLGQILTCGQIFGDYDFRNGTTKTDMENPLVPIGRTASETSISAIKFELRVSAMLGKFSQFGVPN